MFASIIAADLSSTLNSSSPEPAVGDAAQSESCPDVPSVCSLRKPLSQELWGDLCLNEVLELRRSFAHGLGLQCAPTKPSMRHRAQVRRPASGESDTATPGV